MLHSKSLLWSFQHSAHLSDSAVFFALVINARVEVLNLCMILRVVTSVTSTARSYFYRLFCLRKNTAKTLNIYFSAFYLRNSKSGDTFRPLNQGPGCHSLDNITQWIPNLILPIFCLLKWLRCFLLFGYKSAQVLNNSEDVAWRHQRD